MVTALLPPRKEKIYGDLDPENGPGFGVRRLDAALADTGAALGNQRMRPTLQCSIASSSRLSASAASAASGLLISCGILGDTIFRCAEGITDAELGAGVGCRKPLSRSGKFCCAAI